MLQAPLTITTVRSSDTPLSQSTQPSMMPTSGMSRVYLSEIDGRRLSVERSVITSSYPSGFSFYCLKEDWF